MARRSARNASPFEIPAQPSGPAMSDLVLVRKMDTFNEDADPLEPLHYEGGKVIPNLSGMVPHESKSLSLFLILHPDLHATDAPTLEMQVIRNGKAGRLTPLPLRTSRAKDAMIPYLATFQTKSLAPGDYKVKAIMNQGGDSAFQEIAFTVEGSQPGENAGLRMRPAIRRCRDPRVRVCRILISRQIWEGNWPLPLHRPILFLRQARKKQLR
jgi:hypothetical protein